MSVVKFVNGYGGERWQPEISGGRRLWRIYAGMDSFTTWETFDTEHVSARREPVVHRFRWVAEWRANRMEASLRRLRLRQVQPAEDDAQ